MNAKEKGHEVGFSCALIYMKPTKEQFEKIGMHHAKHAYARPEKQQQFMEGFMENWHEPHAKDCACQECRDIRSTIENF